MFTKPTYKKTKKQIGNIRDRIKRKLGKGRGREREREGKGERGRERREGERERERERLYNKLTNMTRSEIWHSGH